MNEYNIEPTGSNPISMEKDLIPVLLDIKELKEKVKQMTIKEVKDTLQLSEEIMAPIVYKIEKQFRLRRPPLEAEIRHAISKTKTMKEAAKYLGVSALTLRKYCQLYDENNSNISNDGSPILPLWKPTRGSKTVKKKNV
jgi:hypothetical protein